MAIIQDGGTGKSAAIDNTARLSTRSVQQSETENATDAGDSYNINTGLVTLTTAGESGVFYLSTNENKNVHIDSVVVIMGPSTGGSATDTTRIRFYRNPTAGTLISGASAVDDNENRNFGSSKVLDSTAYKGAEGNTITDGAVIIESLVSPGSRVAFSIDLVLTKGDAIAVSLEPNDSNTSMKTMVAAVLHVEPNI